MEILGPWEPQLCPPSAPPTMAFLPQGCYPSKAPWAASPSYFSAGLASQVGDGLLPDFACNHH